MQTEFQQQLLQSQIEVQEATISVLGKELHDNIGQLLGSTKLLLGITERALDPIPETLLTANETLSKAIQEMRSLSKVLNKEWLEQFSFTQNLAAEVQRINTAGIIQINFNNASQPILLKADEQIILFRIVQEALQNVVKHSGAKQVNITIFQKEQTVFVSIEDNGSGFDKKTTPEKGIGLLNMHHRAKLLGGSIEWTSGIKQGTIVNIEIPMNINE